MKLFCLTPFSAIAMKIFVVVPALFVYSLGLTHMSFAVSFLRFKYYAGNKTNFFKLCF